MTTAATAPRRSPHRPAALALALLLAAAGAATAGDPPATAAQRADTPQVGLQALELMQRERRERHEVPRMLPLLVAPAAQGRMWIGLARHRREADGTADLRLDAVWVIPIGR